MTMESCVVECRLRVSVMIVWASGNSQARFEMRRSRRLRTDDIRARLRRPDEATAQACTPLMGCVELCRGNMHE